MDANFFPWEDPTTNLPNALLWIQAVVSAFLSFIPVMGSHISTETGPVLELVASAAQAFTAAGFKELSTGGSYLTSVYRTIYFETGF